MTDKKWITKPDARTRPEHMSILGLLAPHPVILSFPAVPKPETTTRDPSNVRVKEGF